MSLKWKQLFLFPAGSYSLFPQIFHRKFLMPEVMSITLKAHINSYLALQGGAGSGKEERLRRHHFPSGSSALSSWGASQKTSIWVRHVSSQTGGTLHFPFRLSRCSKHWTVFFMNSQIMSGDRRASIRSGPASLGISTVLDTISNSYRVF